MTEEEYNKEIEYIFNLFPSYQTSGNIAYKPGLDTMQHLDEISGHPHKCFKTIHIAGTNGKGSTSHLLASSLMQLYSDEFYQCINEKAPNENRKLKVGLYTSPHLWDFRERIKVAEEGKMEMVEKEFVYNFLKNNSDEFAQSKASFFEITTLLSFAYFAFRKVDIAIIECGLGGRLDSTNVITPLMSIITNIGLDHCDHLGHTLEAIAVEKAGIIKENIPIVIGETGEGSDIKLEHSDIKSVFISRAAEKNAPIIFAEQPDEQIKHICKPLAESIKMDEMDLGGDCQNKNINAVIIVLSKLLSLPKHLQLVPKLLYGIYHAAKITGLHGRWERLSFTKDNLPVVICDTGHNAHGFKLLYKQIIETVKKCDSNGNALYNRLVIIFGVAADKDLESIEKFIPKSCVNGNGKELTPIFYFVNGAGPRSLPAAKLADKMLKWGFNGIAIEAEPNKSSVMKGINKYLTDAHTDDFVFIGGSNYVIGQLKDFETIF